MIIDLHNHTTRYSPCSVITERQLIEAYIDSGIDGICITEHNYLWTEEEQYRIVEQYRGKIDIFFGVEVNTDVGHVLVFGGNKQFYYDYLTLRELVNMLDRESTAIVWAHPFRWEAYYNVRVSSELLSYFDAVELYNGNLTPDMIRYADKKLRKYELMLTGGSDTHSIEMAVKYATRFFHPVRSIEELVLSLKQQEYEPVYIRNKKKI